MVYLRVVPLDSVMTEEVVSVTVIEPVPVEDAVGERVTETDPETAVEERTPPINSN